MIPSSFPDRLKPDVLPRVPGELLHLAVIGSYASDVFDDVKSDVDIYGFYWPSPADPKINVGVGVGVESVSMQNANGIKIDFRLYSLPTLFKYIGTPDAYMHAMLWAPPSCVLMTTPAASMVIGARQKLFTPKQPKAYLDFAKKILDEPSQWPKFYYHAQRLIDQALEIFNSQTITLDKNAENWLRIRNGEIGQAEVRAAWADAMTAISGKMFNPESIDTAALMRQIDVVLHPPVDPSDAGLLSSPAVEPPKIEFPPTPA